uniref:Uncharacterized protein n=1 Tax=Rhizophora mucronata TaxID=61149 RepID=A0A2P2MMN2_RHIMU
MSYYTNRLAGKNRYFFFFSFYFLPLQSWLFWIQTNALQTLDPPHCPIKPHSKQGSKAPHIYHQSCDNIAAESKICC